jgi:hypothetical protein
MLADAKNEEPVGRLIPAKRDVWLKVGMALHTVGLRDLWDDWARSSDKYDDAGQDKAWDHFREDRPDGMTIASIYAMAKEYGWDPNVMPPEDEQEGVVFEDVPPQAPPPPPPTSEAVLAELPEGITIQSFCANMETGNYWFMPQGSLWPPRVSMRNCQKCRWSILPGSRCLIKTADKSANHRAPGSTSIDLSKASHGHQASRN